jgi:hypothetical protein
MKNRTPILLVWLAGTLLLTWVTLSWLIPKLLGAVTVGYTTMAAASVTLANGLLSALLVAVLLRLLRK